MEIQITPAEPAAAEDVLALQKIAFQQEADLNNDPLIAPMVETLSELEAAFASHEILVAQDGTRIIGSIRFKSDNGTGLIGRLFVDPAYQGRGIGRRLIKLAESKLTGVASLRLITGGRSTDNIRLYESLGYQITGEMMENETTPLVIMEKQVG